MDFLHHLSTIAISTVLRVYRCSHWHNVFNFIIRSNNLTTALCRIHVQSKSRYSLYITTVPRRITLIYVYIILSAHYMVTITYIRFQRITIHTHFSYSSYLYILSFVHNHIKLPHLHIHLTFILPLSTYTIRQNLMERISMTNKPKDKHLDIVKDSSSDKIVTVVDFWDPLGNPTQPTPETRTPLEVCRWRHLNLNTFILHANAIPNRYTLSQKYTYIKKFLIKDWILEYYLNYVQLVKVNKSFHVLYERSDEYIVWLTNLVDVIHDTLTLNYIEAVKYLSISLLLSLVHKISNDVFNLQLSSFSNISTKFLSESIEIDFNTRPRK